MPGLFLIVLFLFIAFPAVASPALGDAFHSYVKLRALEEELALLPQRTDLEEGARVELQTQIGARLTEARIDFHAVLRSDRATLAPWELKTLERMDNSPHPPSRTLDKVALDFLASTFSRPRELSVLEWQAVGEWFGPETQDAFLKIAFSKEEPSPQTEHRPKKVSVFWIFDPYSRLLSKTDLELQNQSRRQVLKQLVALGYFVDTWEVSSYAHTEEQAEELSTRLSSRLSQGPVLLLTYQEASAILHRTFDLHPGLLHRPEILGWLNVNGRLYGRNEPPPKEEKSIAGRSPASVHNKRPAFPQEEQARRELRLLHREGLVRQPPLGASFPVVNLVSVAAKHRPGANLRESLVSDGQTIFVGEGSGLDALPAALLRARSGRGPKDAGGGLRDSVKEMDF